MEVYNLFTIPLVVIGFTLSFLLAAGIGSNDALNSFGTLFLSKVLNPKKIIILSLIFESLGAILIGIGVTETTRQGIIDFKEIKHAYELSSTCLRPYVNESSLLLAKSQPYIGLKCPQLIHLIGNISVLISSTISLILAKHFQLPTSATHVVVGSIFGYALVALDWKYTEWTVLIKICLSWVVCPIVSGVFSAIICFLLDQLVNKRRNLSVSALVITFLYFLTILSPIFSVCFEHSDFIFKFIKIHLRYSIIYYTCEAILVSSVLLYFILPFLNKKSKVKISQQISQGMNDVIPDIAPTSRLLPLNNTKSSEILNPDESECNNSTKKCLGVLQILTACSKSFGHGANDVANSIAPLIAICLTLNNECLSAIASKQIFFLVYGAIGMAVGVIIWGARVTKNSVKETREIAPVSDFSVDFSSSTTVLIFTLAKLPISTTHCAVGSQIAVGWVRYGFRSLNIKLIASILICWCVSIPIPALLSMLIFWVARFIVSLIA